MRGLRVSALCAFGGLLLLAVLSARGTTAVPSAPRDPEPMTLPTISPPSVTVESSSRRPVEVEAIENDVPGVAATTLLIIVGLLVLAAIALLFLQALRRLRDRERDWAGIPVSDGDVEGVNALRERFRHAAERARGALSVNAGGPPGDAVVAAWLVLEEAAEREGAGRAPHQTSTEFTAALLGAHTTDATALRELRDLYQRARFGQPDAVDEHDVRAARAALDRVLRGIHSPART